MKLIVIPVSSFRIFWDSLSVLRVISCSLAEALCSTAGPGFGGA
jgi:hypothetical protein